MEKSGSDQPWQTLVNYSIHTDLIRESFFSYTDILAGRYFYSYMSLHNASDLSPGS